jgi:caffeoyl-CoA O-methyltransferase
MLVAFLRPRRVLEIGTFTGYSAVAIAEALPPQGELVTCEANGMYVRMARHLLAEVGVGDRVTVVEGPALETMTTFTDPFDLVFIDADKESYLDYYEAALRMLAPGGAIVVDNVLYEGRVLEADTADPQARAIAEFNDVVRDDDRVCCVVLTIRDGVTLIRRADGAAS